jgi:hypothetical protein
MGSKSMIRIRRAKAALRGNSDSDLASRCHLDASIAANLAVLGSPISMLPFATAPFIVASILKDLDSTENRSMA